jgi:hypothetical protein
MQWRRTERDVKFEGQNTASLDMQISADALQKDCSGRYYDTTLMYIQANLIQVSHTILVIARAGLICAITIYYHAPRRCLFGHRGMMHVQVLTILVCSHARVFRCNV